MDDLRYHFKYENIREISCNDFDNAFELLKKDMQRWKLRCKMQKQIEISTNQI